MHGVIPLNGLSAIDVRHLRVDVGGEDGFSPDEVKQSQGGVGVV